MESKLNKDKIDKLIREIIEKEKSFLYEKTIPEYKKRNKLKLLIDKEVNKNEN